jgi:hypothetical protein
VDSSREAGTWRLEQRGRGAAPEPSRPAAPTPAPSSAACTAVAAARSAPGGVDGLVEEGGVAPVGSDAWAMKAMAHSCEAAALGSAALAAAERQAMEA